MNLLHNYGELTLADAAVAIRVQLLVAPLEGLFTELCIGFQVREHGLGKVPELSLFD